MTILPAALLILLAHQLTVRSIEQWADAVTERALRTSLQMADALEPFYALRLARDVEELAYDGALYDAVVSGDPEAAQRALSQRVLETAEAAALYDGKGRRWLSYPEEGQFPPTTATFLPPLAELERAPEQPITSSLPLSGAPGVPAEEFLICAFPLLDEESGAFRGVVAVGKHLPFSRAAIREGEAHYRAVAAQKERAQRWVVAVLLLTGGALVVIAFAVSHWLSRRMTRPIATLLQGTREIGGGNLAYRMPEPAVQEFGELARAFNRMAEHLGQRTDELRRAEKAQVWQEVAQKLAHELRNPLTPIRLSAQRLRRRYTTNRDGFDELLRECTETIEREVTSLQQLLDEFSRLARLPEPDLRPLDVAALVRSTLALFEGLAAPAESDTAGITLVEQIADGLPPVAGDEAQLRRALQNVVKNALEAMPQGGALTVRAHSVEDGARDGVRVDIDDTGVGIAPDVRERLFLPHVSTKREGYGLGLAIVRKIVEDHGGDIVIAQNPGGQGTRVSLVLPTALRALAGGPSKSGAEG
jgi:nitrogen fixation/metabolism regulation signal transduction histidine kinase